MLNEHLSITYETDIVLTYLAELRAIDSLEDIRRLHDKWNGLVPETQVLLDVEEFQLPRLKAFIAEPDTKQNHLWIHARVPRSLLPLTQAALHFGVQDGVVFLQLFHNGMYEVERDGNRLKLRLIRKPKAPAAEPVSN